jgi:hypothetical protein
MSESKCGNCGHSEGFKRNVVGLNKWLCECECHKTEDKKMQESKLPIYVITTVRKERDKDFERRHCVGFFHTKEIAIKSVKLNEMDMQECEYTHAVIEETHHGAYGQITKEIWFEWKKSKKKFFRCAQPRWAKHTCNWGIG